jgi:hypothetical protein
MELLLGLIDSLSVLAVNDEDKTLCAGVVVSPERSDLVLPTDVPHVEFDVFVRDRLDVEANYRHTDVEREYDRGIGGNRPVGMVVTD